MCVTDGWPTVAKMNSYILESDSLTGPWRLVVYMKEFGEQAYFLNFPSKFIARDGQTMWLCYSANFSPGWNGVALKFNPPGGRYGICLHEVRLLKPGEKTPDPPPNYLASDGNLAPKAKVQVSSTYDGYRAEGATDTVPEGYPGDISCEWASRGERAGAWIRLDWDAPRKVARVLLVDRPNNLDQVTAARIEFSDGTSCDVRTPLPDDGSRAVEVRFEPKTITWMKVLVSGVKPDSPNIGFAEVAAFGS
jgi:hypothetical protein